MKPILGIARRQWTDAGCPLPVRKPLQKRIMTFLHNANFILRTAGKEVGSGAGDVPWLWRLMILRQDTFDRFITICEWHNARWAPKPLL